MRLVIFNYYIIEKGHNFFLIKVFGPRSYKSWIQILETRRVLEQDTVSHAPGLISRHKWVGGQLYPILCHPEFPFEFLLKLFFFMECSITCILIIWTGCFDDWINRKSRRYNRWSGKSTLSNRSTSCLNYTFTSN